MVKPGSRDQSSHMGCQCFQETYSTYFSLDCIKYFTDFPYFHSRPDISWEMGICVLTILYESSGACHPGFTGSQLCSWQLGTRKLRWQAIQYYTCSQPGLFGWVGMLFSILLLKRQFTIPGNFRSKTHLQSHLPRKNIFIFGHLLPTC